MNNFSDRLSSLLEGSTQAEFACLLGVHLNSFSSWLRGERYPSYDAILKICTEKCVSADWLLGLSEVKEKAADPPSGAACPGCARRDDQIDELFLQLKALRAELQKKSGAASSPKRAASVA